MNTSHLLQQRENLPRMALKGFLVVKSTGSDGKPEVPVFGKSQIEKIVGLIPTAPMLQGGAIETRGKSINFKYKFVEVGGCDS